MSRTAKQTWITGLLIVLLVASAQARSLIAGELRIQFEKSASASRVDRVAVVGLPEPILKQIQASADVSDTPRRLFKVFAVFDDKPSNTPMLGEYEFVDSKLVFLPRFDFRPGMTYQGVFDPAGVPPFDSTELKRVEASIELPRPAPTAPTKLLAIYPSHEVLPENQLKFYLHFSAPMSRGQAYKRIRLIDDRGQQVEAPFLELAEELWSPDSQRFTLYFDPGRIKRGLAPRELFGPSLIEGRSYKLVVDSKWLDAQGNPLAATVEKKFRVVAPDDVQPHPSRWKIEAPRAGSREPLTVHLDEPLDSALLQRLVSVRKENGGVVAGEIKLQNKERQWVLIPEKPWQSGSYRLIAGVLLEDLAGNSIALPFEVDVLRRPDPKIENGTAEVSFVVTAEAEATQRK